MNHCKVSDSYYILQLYVTTSHFLSYSSMVATNEAETCTCYCYLLYTLFVCLFVLGATAPRGPGPPHSRGF